MKKKIGTLIDEDVLKLAKRRAAEEGRPLNDLIHDALTSYLHRRISDPRGREMAYLLFCERPMQISSEQLKQVLEEDAWDS